MCLEGVVGLTIQSYIVLYHIVFETTLLTEVMVLASVWFSPNISKASKDRSVLPKVAEA
jgi:hypothetical protein